MTVKSALEFRQLVRELRRPMSAAKRRATRLRPSYRLRYPRKLEGQLQRFLESQNGIIWKVFLSWFLSKLPEWRKQRERIRQDSWDTEIELFLKQLEEDFNLAMEAPTRLSVDARSFAERFSVAILEWGRQEFGKALEKALGQALFGSEEWWGSLQEEWLQRFTQRTVTVRRGFVARIRDVVFEGVSKNKSFDTILEEIKRVGEVFTQSKAEFIARDLTGLLDGLIQEKMNLNLGISLYLWQTMVDERVRGRPSGIYPRSIPSHWDMEGKICKWRDPTVVSSDGVTFTPRTARMPQVHPGVEFLCRCNAAPFLEPILGAVDRQLEEEENV